MNKKIIILVSSLIFVLALSITFILYNQNKDIFILDNNKYILETDYRWMTMQNDGGSNTNQYYQINLDTKEIRKCEDRYIGFKGYEYQNKTLYKKIIDDATNNELKIIINNIVTNNKKGVSYEFFTLKTKDVEITINDEETISNLKKILNKIDNLEI